MNGYRSLDFLGSMVGAERAAAEERFRQMYYHTLKPTADGRWILKTWTLKGPRLTGVRFFPNVDEQWARWRSMRRPILVIRGEHSRYSADIAERMLRENPNSKLVTIGDSGHMLPLSHPAEFEAAVREWLGAQK